LLWLLAEDGVPLIVAGEREAADRAAVATAILDVPPERPWVVFDADRDRPDAETLGAALRGGVTPAVILRAASLREVMDRLSAPPDGLPDDAVRRLGVALILSPEGLGPVRVAAAHYLRPIERDGAGHVQRRPPAILATFDPDVGGFEHFAWGITPELADRVDRSQADFERRQTARSTSLARLAATADRDAARTRRTLAALLASEPPREPAPDHRPARPDGPRSPLTDPHLH
jgi:hypothetical protein